MLTRARPWPVTLTAADGLRPSLVLRPLVRADEAEWVRVRRDNADWVGPWEPTVPEGGSPSMPFRQYLRALDRDARAGRSWPFLIEVDGALAGQVHLFGIVGGSLCSAAAGYWVAQRFSGQGVATRALALACDHAFGPGGLHRVEVNIRPENERSLAVVRHLGFRDEGVRSRYLHISGDWRDHRTFALLREDLGGDPVISRWVRHRAAEPAPGDHR